MTIIKFNFQDEYINELKKAKLPNSSLTFGIIVPFHFADKSTSGFYSVNTCF